MAWWVLVATALLAALGLIARRRAGHCNSVREFRDDFFRSANVLAEDDRTPEIVVDLFHFLAAQIADWKAPWKLLRALLMGRISESIQQPSDSTKRLLSEINQLPEPLKAQAFKAMSAFALAITFNSIEIGWVIRRLALFAVRKRNGKNYDGGDDAEAIVIGYADKRYSTA